MAGRGRHLRVVGAEPVAPQEPGAFPLWEKVSC